MTPPELLAYLGPAAVLVLLVVAAAAAAGWMLGRPLPGRVALTQALSLFFLTLTQYPLPDPAVLDCSTGGMAPILRPFATLDHFARLGRHPFSWDLWLGNKVVQASVMNFALPAAIGAAFARHARGPRSAAKALALGAGLSLGAELAQLTGLFGLYPCAWRTFEVDDLILNTGGLMAGFGLGRGRARGTSRTGAVQ